MRLFTRHPLIRDLVELRGNARSCVYTEPLWGIPYNLYTPFVAVYMQRLGLMDETIGAILTLGLLCQVVTSLFGGVIADKLGRRAATLVFDCVSWSTACLIWAFARNVWWFVAGAVLNSIWQVTSNSWNSLMVEDADQQKLVSMYAWVTISGMLAVFFAPLSGILVGRVGVIAAMRALYLFSFAMMTAKFVILYFFSTETARGRLRMEQTQNESVMSMLSGYKGVVLTILKSRPLMLTLGILISIQITTMITDTFFPLFVTGNLGVPEAMLGFFPMVRAAIILTVLFVIPHTDAESYKVPMIIGIALYVAAQLLLIFSPARGYATLFLYVGAGALAYALIVPRRDALLAIAADQEDRSRIVALITVLVIGVTAPFGYIAGWLSSVSRALPFVLNILLLALCGAMVFFVRLKPAERKA